MNNTAAQTQNGSKSSQRLANIRQNEKRRGQARLPSVYLEKNEQDLVETLAQLAGNKRAAIMAGLALLEKQYITEGKLPA